MAQNLVTLDLTDAQLAAALAALQQLEAALPGLIAFEIGERRGLPLMGPRSEPFARQTLRVLEQNPGIVPPSLDLAAARADLEAHDRLRPLLERLQRLTARVDDTVAALGSDVMDVALEGYALVKVSGRAQGLDELRRELSGRFAKTRRKEAAPAQAMACVRPATPSFGAALLFVGALTISRTFAGIWRIN